MPLEPGQTLGHYRIVSAIGAGGMGEVYRATDSRLARDIAIKILPAQVLTNPERLARFRREAQLLASLNHPNIASIYGFEEAAGQPFLALELVEGEDLAERLTRGPVPLDEAIEMARQIAEGVEEAHERGVVHRDLKPANVRVTPDGRVKILDFGLAKAFAGETADRGASGDLSQSPTLTGLAATQTGVILGTAAYMSPEQARGRPVDRRADIWSFGVLLYEMLTGKQLFRGETVTDILAAVLTREADLTLLPGGTPPALRRLMARCLERDPRRRLRDMGEARFLIHEIQGGVTEVTAPQDNRVGVRRPTVAALVGLTTIALLGGGYFIGSRWGMTRPPASPTRPTRYALEPLPGVEKIWAPAVANDGTFVVYEGHIKGNTNLFVHRFDEFTPRLLKGTEGATGPFLSPDGRWVAFRQGRTLRKTAISGGDLLTICELRSGSFPGATWRPDGTILFAPSWLTGLSTVSAEGGEPKPLTEPDRGNNEAAHWWPQVHPGGVGALFTIWRPGSGMNDSMVGWLDYATNQHRSLFPGADARFMPPSHVIYYRAGAYHAMPFDFVALQPSGDSVPVLEEALDLDPAGDQFKPLSVSQSGTLAYTTSRKFEELRLAWLAPGEAPAPLPFPARKYVAMDLSPDGRTVAVASVEAGRYEIRLLDLSRGTEQHLDLPGSNWSPRWGPQGGILAFRSMRKGDFDIYQIDIAGGGREQPILSTDEDEVPRAWSPDGRHLIFTTSRPDGATHTMILSLGEAAEKSLFATYSFSAADVSRDGRWIAYASESSGRTEIYVQRFPGPGASTRISLSGGIAPRWSPAGDELFFQHEDTVIATRFRIEGDRFVAGSERILFEAPITRPDSPLITPDGRRFLVLLRSSTPEPPRLRVIRNWNLD